MLPHAPGAPALLRRVNAALASLIAFLLIISVAVLVFPVTLQILSRYTPLIPAYIWTEELARFCLVYAVMLGAMLAVREGTHFVVDVFPRLSPRGEAKVELVAGSFVLIFALVFLWWGWEFTEFAIYRISELAELPLWIIHAAWPIAGAVWLLFEAERMLNAAAVLREQA
ncbi:TRAP transporter small permease [Belnapia rosea]|uniref:TRAP transporter small permease protein n=1 Tax=Belnapia rosea TaxID=938405 RepID=A0A1G6VJW4_9PROT|nr:TRAP transporter small permease [Belnapia rosea]SDB37544.1 TRAP-type C4-dicarboxylate transport system, small permease component [Belnapia rosea]SDD53693.1 TRAP-type C4-dicarboxylate transport system, small permease component [Belnapia rosea]